MKLNHSNIKNKWLSIETDINSDCSIGTVETVENKSVPVLIWCILVNW